MRTPNLQQAKIRFYNNIYKRCVAQAKLGGGFDNYDNGKRILQNKTELVGYIALYGGHHYHKLRAAFAARKFGNIQGREVEIIDWGCGQALATCVLIDYLIEQEIDLKFTQITLIEPSKLALKQGSTYIQAMFQNDANAGSIIRCINKDLDSLKVSDIISDPKRIKLHLFSNILDVNSFDLIKLYKLIVGCYRGSNCFICTSPFYNGASRIDQFYNLFAQSHVVIEQSIVDKSEQLEGEIFDVIQGRYRLFPIQRREKQFIVNL
ncbi:hypothetical protein [Argonema antarcticum]|uniref:hypothetical protein n=1 Tax=Argonema antarcticum TaxID=2942763 RepID=UPI002012A697|nr:hypothetical protein [Argonema antarcticum]MCL1470465.1 hypothetical protein [Argonema antarcticum A004/B2]